MEVELQELLASVSRSVQKAEQTLDLAAAEHFLKISKETVEVGEKEAVEISAAALLHHQTILLDEVSVRMGVYLRNDGTKVMAKLGACTKDRGKGKNEKETAGAATEISEINLVYKREPASEGIARITNQLNKDL